MVSARTATALLALGAVAAMAVAGWFGWLAMDRAQLDEARTSGLAAAAELTARLLTYDAATIEQDASAAEAATTGPFHDEFTALMRDRITPTAGQQHAKSTATVVQQAVVETHPDRVVALLFVNQTTTSDHLPAPRIDAGSAKVTVERTDGRWLVSGLEAA